MRPSLLLLVLVACSAAHVSPGALPSGADALRAELANADDVKRGLILDELAKLELRRAQEANTVAAYRRFLTEFTGGEEATAARALLEGLCFDGAATSNTERGWSAFLDEFPRGRHAPDARLRLSELVIDDALSSGQLEPVRRALARFPESARRPQLAAREDELAWKATSRVDSEPVRRYLAEHPGGAFRAEALLVLDQLARDQIRAAGDLASAKARAARADGSAEDRALVDDLEWERARVSLDPAELARLGASGSSHSATARGLVESLQSAPLPAPIAAAVREAQPGAGLPAEDQLQKMLAASDPQDRVDALALVAERGAPADLDRVLEAADSRYIDVRLAALEALRTYARLPPDAVWRGFATSREAEALSRALSAPYWRRVAALRDASGRTKDALAAWLEVLRADPDDLAARQRVLSLQRELGDRIALGAAARELVKDARSFAEGRWLQPTDPTVPAAGAKEGPGRVVGSRAEVAVLRQFCAAIELAQQGREALVALRPAAGAGEQELIGVVIADADRALASLRSKRAELEAAEKRADKAFRPCGGSSTAAVVAAARKSRLEAARLVASTRDPRLEPFLRSLARTSDPELKALVESAR